MSSQKERTSSSIPELNPPLSHPKDNNGVSYFYSNMGHQEQGSMPKEFVWPSEYLVKSSGEQLNEPLIDLGCIINAENNDDVDDEAAIASAAELVRKACSNHGFFQVINHGVDQNLINGAREEVDSIFKIPMSKKLGAKKKPGLISGYSVAHADRYSSKLPWKETFSFMYNHQSMKNRSQMQVVDYFESVFGQHFQHTGQVYEKYCEAMVGLSLRIMELLAISLGIEDRLHYRRYFQDGDSIMRCNYYPPCNNPSLTFGTGPHTDPTSLTILHQDQVGGLEVFSDNKWFAVRPLPQALVINIGDTFTALSNGIYKSCLHRALVNSDMERKSLAFFVCPRQDKTVTPPDNLLSTKSSPRNYPDFTWSDLLDFTQNHYRADDSTLQRFIHWHSCINSNSSSKI